MPNCLDHCGWEQIGRHLLDEIFKFIFVELFVKYFFQSSLGFVTHGTVLGLALVQIMEWCQIGGNALSEPLVACLLKHLFWHLASMSWTVELLGNAMGWFTFNQSIQNYKRYITYLLFRRLHIDILNSIHCSIYQSDFERTTLRCHELEDESWPVLSEWWLHETKITEI